MIFVFYAALLWQELLITHITDKISNQRFWRSFIYLLQRKKYNNPKEVSLTTSKRERMCNIISNQGNAD